MRIYVPFQKLSLELILKIDTAFLTYEEYLIGSKNITSMIFDFGIIDGQLILDKILNFKVYFLSVLDLIEELLIL